MVKKSSPKRLSDVEEKTQPQQEAQPVPIISFDSSKLELRRNTTAKKEASSFFLSLIPNILKMVLGQAFPIPRDLGTFPLPVINKETGKRDSRKESEYIRECELLALAVIETHNEKVKAANGGELPPSWTGYYLADGWYQKMYRLIVCDVIYRSDTPQGLALLGEVKTQ